MPFTYLGLPLGTTRVTISELSPLVCRLERKLTSSSCFLSQGAQLQLINSALASMPLHFLCTLQLPPGLTVQLDRILWQCLWHDQDGEPKQSLAAWEMICKSKLKGGLGVVNFQKKNAALLIKFLGKFYNKKDIPWVDLMRFAYYQGKVRHEENLCGWRDVCKQVDNFRGVAYVTLGAGDTTSFCHDNWNLSGCKQNWSVRFPRLFSFSLKDKVSISEVYQMEDMLNLFYRPLSHRHPRN
jgi:hypothetical protein